MKLCIVTSSVMFCYFQKPACCIKEDEAVLSMLQQGLKPLAITNH